MNNIIRESTLILDDEPRAGAADLTSMNEYSRKNNVNREIEGGVSEDNVGVFATQLYTASLDALCTTLDDALARRETTSERHKVHIGRFGQSWPNALTTGCKQLNCLWRNTCLDHELVQINGGQRRNFRGFNNN